MGNRVNIGAQVVTAHAERRLDGQDVLGGQAFSGDNPLADGRLPLADNPAERRLPAGEVDGFQEGGGVGRNIRHAEGSNGTPLDTQSEKRKGLANCKPLDNGGEHANGSARDGVRFSGVDDVKSVTGDRIQMRLDELKISQAELARRCGLAQSTVNGLINRHSHSNTHLHIITQQLGVSTAWLAGVRALADRGGLADELAEEAAEKLNFELVPEVELSKLESGFPSLVSVASHIPVSRDWLNDWIGERDKGLVFITRGDGDDMAPTIARGDLAGVDELEIRAMDKLWCVSVGGVAVLKRVRRLPDGWFELRSDNPSVAPMTLPASDVRVVGAVVAVMKRF